MHDIAAHVITQETLTADYRCLVLDAPAIAQSAQPGQFIHLRVTGLEHSALRRPFSIYRVEGNRLSVLYKTVGRGTDQLGRLRTGDTLAAMGPLGNGFPLKPEGTLPILVAGGFGVAPLAFLARHLPTKGVVLIGGRSADDILCADDFTALGWEVRIATMDGSRGENGLVTLLIDNWLAENPGKNPEFYTCGPYGMLRAVTDRAARAQACAWVSLDKHMVCGVGACLACVQRLRRPDGSTWIARVCRDGPVFKGSDVVWEEQL